MKKLFLVASLALLLMCTFALTVNATECDHQDNWELKFGPNGVLGSWEAINVCPNCGLVLKDEFCEPLVLSRGYSYYTDSFSQGFAVNRAMVDKYEAYSGEIFNYGLVAGISAQIGVDPLNSDGTVIQDGCIMADFTESKISLFDVKIVNVPSDQLNTKIVACMYAIHGGDVTYIDGENGGSLVAGITYNEVVDAVEENGIPQGTEEYRVLTAEEMDLVFASYWNSTSSTARITVNNDPRKFVSTRMLSRDELPSGSYAVVTDGWSVRPEAWKTDANGNVIKSSERHGSKGTGTYQLSEWWRDSDSAQSDYKYMAFNISAAKGGYLDDMSPESIAQAIQIYVPATTKVAKNEVAKADDVSVEGMQLYDWTTSNLNKGKYWYSTSSATAMSSSNNFYATCQFTKETLPVGSVIEINEGWMYRAESWKTADTKASSRGPLVTTYRIEVTEEFWNDVSVRGFNISRLTGGSLSGYDFEEVAEAFKIYLPAQE